MSATSVLGLVDASRARALDDDDEKLAATKSSLDNYILSGGFAEKCGSVSGAADIALRAWSVIVPVSIYPAGRAMALTALKAILWNLLEAEGAKVSKMMILIFY